LMEKCPFLFVFSFSFSYYNTLLLFKIQNKNLIKKAKLN